MAISTRPTRVPPHYGVSGINDPGRIQINDAEPPRTPPPSSTPSRLGDPAPGDGGVEEPPPDPGLPPPPPPLPEEGAPGTAGGSFLGSFLQPGQPGASAFRSPKFLQGRMVGGPEPLRFGPGAAIGGSVDLGGQGQSPFAGDEEELRRRLMEVILGRSRG